MRFFSALRAWLLLSFLLLPLATSALSGVLNGSFRSYPFGISAEATLQEDWLAWDGRTEEKYWNYGLTQVALSLATHGATEASFSYYPISFVKIMAGIGGTYRFMEIADYNCATVSCGGFLSKNRVGARFVIPLDSKGDFVLFPELNIISVSHPDKTRDFADETEMILGRNGSDTLETAGIFLGRTVTKVHAAGFYLKSARYRASGAQKEMMLLVFRGDWKTSALNFGVGRYQSTHHVSGFTIAFDYEMKFGESLSLF